MNEKFVVSTWTVRQQVDDNEWMYARECLWVYLWEFLSMAGTYSGGIMICVTTVVS